MLGVEHVTLNFKSIVMVRTLGILIAVLVAQTSFGQFSSKTSWSYTLYLGGSNLLGDLGGGSSEGKSDFRDLDVRSTRPAIGVGLQRHTNNFTLSTDLIVTQLYGNDAYSNEASRAARNLSVRTDLVEASMKAEFLPFTKTALKGLYVNGGIGGIYYQPKALYNDEYIKLRPLGTEGQNYMTDKSVYNTYSVVIPFGVGYKFQLNRHHTLKLDFAFRKSFTDYLDDVSTEYANSAALAEAGGSLAPILADRSVNGMREGSVRGNSDNMDNYFFVGLKFEKRIGAKRYDDCTNFELPKRRR